jgi:radical SAM protein with 4Fe4S-binding SPASM domain
MSKELDIQKQATEAEPGLYAYGVLYQSQRWTEWEEGQPESYFHYRQEWNSRVVQRSPGKIPLNLNVEVTTRCNLACTFCSHPSLTKEQTGDLPIAIFERTLQQAHECGGIKAVNLNGLGEPTLRNDLHEFVSIAKRNAVNDVMFHTNGTQLVSESYIEKLIDAGLDRVIVSVDSPDKETYEAMRLIKGSWDKKMNSYRKSVKGSPHELLVDNTRRLLQYVKKRGLKQPIIRVTCVLTDKTFQQMKQFKEFWINEGADLITYQDLTWHDKLMKSDNSILPWQSSEKSAINNEYEAIRNLPTEAKKEFVCPPLYQSAWIEFNGNVVPCSHPDAREHMIMGSLETDTMSSIWQSEKYQALRELHESGTWEKHPVCGRCEVPLIEIRKRMTGKSVVSPEVNVERF